MRGKRSVRSFSYRARTHHGPRSLRALHGLHSTLHHRACLLVRVTTDAPSLGHSVLNLRNIYITRHIPSANRTARSQAGSRTGEPSSCHFGFRLRRWAASRPPPRLAFTSRYRGPDGLLCENVDVTAVATFGGKIKKCELVGRSGRPAARGTCRSIVGRVREAPARDVSRAPPRRASAALNGHHGGRRCHRATAPPPPVYALII